MQLGTVVRYSIILLVLIDGGCRPLTDLWYNQRGYSGYIKEMALRKSVRSKGQVKCAYVDNIRVTTLPSSITIEAEGYKLDIKYLVKVNESPDLYVGETVGGLFYSVYFYYQRDRFYIQLTPIPKGFSSEIFEDEKVYVITDQNICY